MLLSLFGKAKTQREPLINLHHYNPISAHNIHISQGYCVRVGIGVLWELQQMAFPNKQQPIKVFHLWVLWLVGPLFSYKFSAHPHGACLIAVRPSTHTRDVNIPSLMLESVCSLHTASHALSPLDQQVRSQPQRWLHCTDDVMGDSVLWLALYSFISSSSSTQWPPLCPWPPSIPLWRAWPLPHRQFPLRLPPPIPTLRTSACQRKACEVITSVATSNPPPSLL